MTVAWFSHRRFVVFQSGLWAALFFATGTNALAQKKPDVKAQCVNAYKDGQVHRKNGELLLARDEFKVCAENVCPTVLRKDCGPWLKKVEESIPSIVVSTSSAASKPLTNVQISIDGKITELLGKEGDIEIDPGPHIIRVEAAAHQAIERSIKVRPGEKKTQVELELVPVKPTESQMYRPIPGSAIAFGIVGLAGVASFAGFGLHGNALKSDLEVCKPGCAPMRVDAVKRDYLIADVGLGIGVVFLGLTTWAFLTRPEVPRPSVGWHVNVLPGQTTLVVRGSF